MAQSLLHRKQTYADLQLAGIPCIRWFESLEEFQAAKKRLDLEGYQCEILDSESNSPSLKVNSLDPDLQDFIEFKATSPYSWLVCRKFGSLSQ